MGISTYQSYCGAQIFDAVGLSSAFVNQYFFGTATTIEGVGLEEIAEKPFSGIARRSRTASCSATSSMSAASITSASARGSHLVVGGRGRSPARVRTNARDRYDAYAQRIDEVENRYQTIRGLFHIKKATETGRNPVPVDESSPPARS